MIGKQILNYKIISKIGEGGMATVYLAKHIRLDTLVAIKILKPVLATNQKIRQRFIQEAKIMASLNHPNITKVLDFEEYKDRLAIVIEYLEGMTLKDYTKQKGGLNTDEAIKLFENILPAFDFAHKKGIVHRDIKPSNIFITKTGEIKIMDFGIAKMVEEKTLTRTGAQMGTPAYMSPEQVNDAKHIDNLSDIYSLGVLLWFVLKGKPPYDISNTSLFSIYKKIDSEPLPKLNNKLDPVIQKATQKDKNKRFFTCSEFLTTLLKDDTESKSVENTKKLINDKTKEVKYNDSNIESFNVISFFYVLISLFVIFVIYEWNRLGNTNNKKEHVKGYSNKEVTKEAVKDAAEVTKDAVKVPVIGGADGKALFQNNGCIACHQMDAKTIGPAIKEIAKAYAGKKDDLVKFFKEEGKAIVDPAQYGIMKPNLALTKTMSDDERSALADYIINTYNDKSYIEFNHKSRNKQKYISQDAYKETHKQNEYMIQPGNPRNLLREKLALMKEWDEEVEKLGKELQKIDKKGK